MDPEAYLNLLTNSVYSREKAKEMKSVIEYLGGNWFTLKEKIKEIKLQNAPPVKSKLLAKNIQ